MKAIKLKLENFKLASEILKKDKNFIMQIIEVNPKILKYIHVNFRNHRVNKAFIGHYLKSNIVKWKMHKICK